MPDQKQTVIDHRILSPATLDQIRELHEGWGGAPGQETIGRLLDHIDALAEAPPAPVPSGADALREAAERVVEAMGRLDVARSTRRDLTDPAQALGAAVAALGRALASAPAVASSGAEGGEDQCWCAYGQKLPHGHQPGDSPDSCPLVAAVEPRQWTSTDMPCDRCKGRRFVMGGLGGGEIPCPYCHASGRQPAPSASAGAEGEREHARAIAFDALAAGLRGFAQLVLDYIDRAYEHELREADPICSLGNAAAAVRDDPADVQVYVYADGGPSQDEVAMLALIAAGKVLADGFDPVPVPAPAVTDPEGDVHGMRLALVEAWVAGDENAVSFDVDGSSGEVERLAEAYADSVIADARDAVAGADPEGEALSQLVRRVDAARDRIADERREEHKTRGNSHRLGVEDYCSGLYRMADVVRAEAARLGGVEGKADRG